MTRSKISAKIGLKEVVAFLILGVIAGLIINNRADVSVFLTQKEKLEVWVNSFGDLRYFVFVLIQILQVVIFIIPGEVVHIAGGYLFGSFLSSILSILGITLGSLICFTVARTLGQPLIERIISEPNMKKFKAMIGTRKTSISLFFIFMIPGLPGKDAVAYVAGFTPIRFIDFFIVTLIARSPWIIVSSFWGANLEKGNYTMLAIITVLVGAVFLASIIKGKYLLNYISGKVKINKQK